MLFFAFQVGQTNLESRNHDIVLNSFLAPLDLALHIADDMRKNEQKILVADFKGPSSLLYLLLTEIGL